jgi:hypothetical protein
LLVNGVRCKSIPEFGVKDAGPSRSSTGDSTGGNADEAATACDRLSVGDFTSPTR